MAEITQKSRLKAEDARQKSAQLIDQIKALKEIKPRQEWVFLLKFEILNLKSETNPKFSNFEFRISNFFFGLKARKSLAYSLATFVFVIVGLIGFAQYTMPGDLLFPVKRIAEQSQAALSGQTGLQQNVATLSNRINDLAQAAREGKKNNIPSTISEINTQVSALAKDLKDNPVTDQKTIKEIAASLKTLADVPGTDLTQNPDVKDLYQTIVESQIADLEKTTLTDVQKDILTVAKELYGQEKYIDALEKILTIGN